jgi:hypothetical protein
MFPKTEKVSIAVKKLEAHPSDCQCNPGDQRCHLCQFTELPPELLLTIFEDLHHAGHLAVLASLAQTCEALRELVYSVLWKQVRWSERYIENQDPSYGLALHDGWSHMR